MRTPIQVSYRAHPAYVGQEINLRKFARLDIYDSVREAVRAASVVMCGTISSVVVEALCSGRRTIVIADPHLFFTIPLNGMFGVERVSNSRGLVAALACDQPPVHRFSIDRLFDTREQIPKWRRLLANSLI